MNFSASALLSFCRRFLLALGTPPAAADTVAEHLVGAELAGHESHGVIRLAQYRQHVAEGRIDPRAAPRITRETLTTALIDGALAWGQVTAKRAMDLAIDKARVHGLAAVAARECYHIGRAGVYPLAAARAGFIAQVFCNGHGIARVAPWGGTEPKLATNPIAIAVPRRGEPVLVDITTSVVAEGKVRVARSAGRPIPEGWVLDGNGAPTTDPAALYAGGSLLPFGGREGHKGYGLSVMVDLLGGVLSGAGCGFMTPKIGNGLLIVVLDPAAFEAREAFLDRVEAYLAYLKSSPTRPGVEAILLPGEPELLSEARRRAQGIELSPGVLEQLRKLAEELRIDPL